MEKYFSFERFIKIVPVLASYLPVTLKEMGIVILLATAAGVLIALIRVYKVPVLSQFFQLYLLLMRGVPYMILIMVVYYFLPFLAQKVTGVSINNWEKIVFAEITFVLHESAYIGEIIRGAVESVPKVQKEAAYTVGLNEIQTYFRIILPQSIKVAIPAYGANFVEIFQNTAITYLIGVLDFMGAANSFGNSMHSSMETYTFAAIVYVTISILIEMIFKFLDSKYQFGVKTVV